MKKSHLERNTIALLSACFKAVESVNKDKFRDEGSKQNFQNISRTIIDLMIDIVYPKNDGIGLSPSQSFGYVGKSFDQFGSLGLRQSHNVRKIFDKVSIIATDVDQTIEYNLIAAMTDNEFDDLFSRLQKEVGTDLNIDTFSLKLDLERQKRDEDEKLMASFGHRVFRI